LPKSPSWWSAPKKRAESHRRRLPGEDLLDALDLYRAKTWRAGIDRKLTIIRDTYAMMNAEAQARRAEVLELAIIFLIVFEIVLSLIKR
jgi:hypothetical protein